MIMGGRPVAMYISDPLALACVSACMADAGIRWVLKLTRVPSMSKNNAYLLFVIPANKHTNYLSIFVYGFKRKRTIRGDIHIAAFLADNVL